MRRKRVKKFACGVIDRTQSQSGYSGEHDPRWNPALAKQEACQVCWPDMSLYFPASILRTRAFLTTAAASTGMPSL
jgi:hypothetical protein